MKRRNPSTAFQRIPALDPLSAVVDLIVDGKPIPLAWAERWSAVWKDPVIGAWNASRDPVGMAILIATVVPREIQAVANAVWRPMLRKNVGDPLAIEKEIRSAIERNVRMYPAVMRWKIEEDMADRIRNFVERIPTLGYLIRWSRKRE